MDAKGWHVMAVSMAGASSSISVDGRILLEVKDESFSKPGRIGLWTNADAVTHFDQRTVPRFSLHDVAVRCHVLVAG